MASAYTKYQKALIMIFGDFMSAPLDFAERKTVSDALESVEGDPFQLTSFLDQGCAERVESLLSQSMRLTTKLDVLSQKGIDVIFPNQGFPEFIQDALEYVPPFLFAIGNIALLDNKDPEVFYTKATFAKAGFQGIFLIDRSFDALLRDPEVVKAIKDARALLVSDGVKGAAVKPEIKKRKPQQKKQVTRPAQTSQGDMISRAVGVDEDKRAELGKTEGISEAKTVFISGSRSQSQIPPVVQQSLETIMEKDYSIIIGDSEKGVDKEIADFLRVPLYPNVSIYTVGAHARIQPDPSWELVVVPVDSSLKGRDRQTEKDRVMAKTAHWGLAIFNPIEKNRFGALQVSSGTLRNTVQMLLEGKPVKLFYTYSGEMRFKDLKSVEQLEELLQSYGEEKISPADQQIILTAKGMDPHEDPAAIKQHIVMKKFYELLKKEQEQQWGSSETEGLVSVIEMASSYVPLQEELPLFQ